jgi:poly(A) polymerase Pap1
MRFGSEEWKTVGDAFSTGFPGGVSHSLCDDCIRTLYPDNAESIIQQMREMEEL